jgi:hypothetical protein
MNMRVLINHPVESALKLLNGDDRDRVMALFRQLANWERDPNVRDNSKLLAGCSNIYFIRTFTNVRIFFIISGRDVLLIDIAQKDSTHWLDRLSVEESEEAAK